MQMKMKIAAVAAVAVGALGVAQVASAQDLRLVNHGAVTGHQAAQFTNAARDTIDQMGNVWDTPNLHWTNNAGWTIDLYKTPGPVESICGEFAAGCHYLKNGVPHAIIDTSWGDTHRVWSVAGTHELEEMWIDPHLQRMTTMNDGSGDAWLVEAADPVEDHHFRVAGLQVSDYVYPDWYWGIDGRHDAMNVLDHHTGFDVWQFSCPSGIGYYMHDGLWYDLGCDTNDMRGAQGFAKRESLSATNPVVKRGNLRVL